ncbi:MAG: hypothetical protein RIT27_921 [Pseudomonadota bacterium]|jgi:type IV pilus assembly protein PilE
MKKHDVGFTLVELMIVVGIMGILAAIAIPQYDQYLRKSKRAEAKTALSGIAQLQETFYVNNGNRYASKLGSGGLNCHKKGLCKADGGTTAPSSEGNYTIEISSVTNTGFALKATAASPGQLKDAQCAVFTLDSRGQKTATSNDCW